MRDCHRDNYIHRLIGSVVRVVTKDGLKVEGRLAKYEYGKYIMETREYDFAFRKSHIKSIKRISNG